MKITVLLTLFSLGLLILSSLFTPVMGDTSGITGTFNPLVGDTVLEIENKTIYKDDTFTINVTCYPALRVESWEFSIEFNSSILQADNVTEGSLFGGYSTSFNDGSINNTVGNITSMYCLIIGAGNVSETGTCIQVNFTAIDEGESEIDFVYDGVHIVPGVTNETEYVSLAVSNATVTVLNTGAPTQANENPLDTETGVATVPQLSITCNDGNGETMAINWSSDSSGSWVIFGSNQSTNGTFYQTNSNFSLYNTRYNWSVNITDGVYWSNETYYFDTDEITFTPISLVPEDILITTTGSGVITYNLSTTTSGINGTSVFITHLMNSTEVLDSDCQLNTSYILEETDWLVDKYGAGSRAEDHWFEMFNASGTGEIGYPGQWRVKNDTLSSGFVVNSHGPTWYNFSITVPVENLFGKIMMGNPPVMRAEDKAGQTFEVYKDNITKVSFNMSDTCFWDDSQYNNTNYGFHVYGAPSGGTNKPLRVYFANDSYTGNPQTSPYTELIGQIDPGDSYELEPANSKYYHISFSTDHNGLVGTVGMTENFSFIFETSQANIGACWNIYYADDNTTHGDHYHDFYNNTCSYLSTDDGTTWSNTPGIIDTWMAYAKLDSTDEIMYKVYAQINDTTTGDGQWSATGTELIDEGNFAPNNPDVITPNGTSPTDQYTIGESINITYNWLGDPNHETCWVNTTVHDNTTDVITYYVENRSITDIETHINNSWYYNWDTSGLSSGGPYYVNITATDPDGNYSWGKQNGTFNLTSAGTVSMTNPYPTNTSWVGINISDMNITVSNPLGETMNVYFYWFNNGTLIDSDLSVSNDTVANVTVPFSYEYYTHYTWNVTVVSSSYNNQSGNWSLTGESEDPDVSRNQAVGPEDLSGVAAHYMESGDYGRWIRSDINWNGAVGPEDLSGVAAHYMESY